MKLVKIVLLFLFVVSCAPIYVNYDYEKSTNFSKYKTYNFYDNMETGFTGLDEKRFVLAIKNKLKALGLEQSERPDFLIDIKSSTFEDNQRNTVGLGVGGIEGNVGGGISVGIPVGQAKINREIIVEFVDASKMGVFWQAKSISSFNSNTSPEKREIRINTIVEKTLVKYPPSK